MEITLLKLGGSLITDKTKAYTARHEIIKQIVFEIKQAIQENPGLNLILGNGAGSYAHQSAKKYGTIDGFKDHTSTYGACKVHTDAIKLHTIILEECIAQGLPVFSLQPSAWILSENKKTISVNIESLTTALEKGMIPFVYGDVILDSEIGATIFSTDKIFSIITEYLKDNPDLKIKQIIHAGNYDGVLDTQGNVISVINHHNYEQMKQHLKTSELTDVTGGMISKVDESMRLAALGIDSFIVNGSIKNILLESLKKNASSGTYITY